MNLPNYLTLARIFLVPLLVVVLLNPYSEHWFGVSSYVIAIIIFLLASLTDILDGHLPAADNSQSLGHFSIRLRTNFLSQRH